MLDPDSDAVSSRHSSDIDDVTRTGFTAANRDVRRCRMPRHVDTNWIATCQNPRTRNIRADIVAGYTSIERITQRHTRLSCDDDVACRQRKPANQRVITGGRYAMQCVLNGCCAGRIRPNEVAGDRVGIASDIHAVPQVARDHIGSNQQKICVT